MEKAIFGLRKPSCWVRDHKIKDDADADADDEDEEEEEVEENEKYRRGQKKKRKEKEKGFDCSVISGFSRWSPSDR